jgi:hypothetical protein
VVTSIVVRILCRFQWKGLILNLVLWCPLLFLGGSEAHAFCSLLGTPVFGLTIFLRPASAAPRDCSCCVAFLQAIAVISRARSASGLPLIPAPLSFCFSLHNTVHHASNFQLPAFPFCPTCFYRSPAAAVLRQSFSVLLLFSSVLASLAAQIILALISLPHVKSRPSALSAAQESAPGPVFRCRLHFLFTC